jgi:hypothetical protein
MVVVRFKPGTEPGVPERMFAALHRLQRLLPGIEYVRGGPYASPEGLNEGFTHGFLVTFHDAAARDHYLTDPEHEALKADILPAVEQVIAFDFAE